MVSFFVSAITWASDRPDGATWACRLGGAAAAMLALVAFLTMHFRADLVHDYLRDVDPNYFNRDGFCFAPCVATVNGIAYLLIYFQNQRDRPCIARIALRPARGFFMNRAPIQTIIYQVECEPAAFGVARISLPIPRPLQGKRQSFDVGASVRYPAGKGKQLRFRDGIIIRSDANFEDSFGEAIAVAGFIAGHIVLQKPPTARILLPANVAEDLPGEPVSDVRTLWRLEDPSLERTAITLTPEGQLAFWNSLNEAPVLTESQRRLGAIMRGE